jgi:hypothetical protein
MRDAQGHELSGATTEATGHFDRAVRAFTLIYGDASGLYDAALKAAPDLVMHTSARRGHSRSRMIPSWPSRLAPCWIRPVPCR